MKNSFPFPLLGELGSAIEQLQQRAGHAQSHDHPKLLALAASIRGLVSIAVVCTRNWPVEVDEALAKQLVRSLTEVGDKLLREEQQGTWFGNAGTLVALVEQATADVADTRLRIYAIEPDKYQKELEFLVERRNVLDESIRTLTEVAKDKTNLHTVEKQSNYYHEQAQRFWRIAAVALALFVGLSIYFGCRIHSLHSAGGLVAEYSAEQAHLSEVSDASMTGCSDCMRTLFLNILIKSNAVRILEVTFILFLIAVALKAFNSAAHNYTINMQRSNSLRAALLLLERSHSDEAKDAMMDKAAAAIFSHQPTGYNQKPPANLVQNVMEWGKRDATD